MRFRLEVPRSAMIAMGRRYAGEDGWSTWWDDLIAACRHVQATWWDWDGPITVEGEHDDRDPVAGRLISELEALGRALGNAAGEAGA